MGYPEDSLAPDEELILHTHPHWKMLFWPAIWFIGGTAAAGFAAGMAFRHVPVGIGRTAATLAILAAWLYLVGHSVVRLAAWATTHFVITGRRVLVREGVLTRVGRDIPLSRISSVQFRHTLFDRVLGTGTLIIESSAQEPLEYDDIPHVEDVHALLYHEVFDAGHLHNG
ncbi:MAG: PH domain-containing protein [Mycobacteriaceae bacterium]|nr:PH domain-containing protein [Mycobacteriaceae bacterium]